MCNLRLVLGAMWALHHLTKFLVSWKKDKNVADNKNIMKSLGRKMLLLPRKEEDNCNMHQILSPCLFH